jgi:uncharacterized protein
LVSGVSIAVFIGITNWETVAGLMVGALFAAPVAVKRTGVLPTNVPMAHALIIPFATSFC